MKGISLQNDTEARRVIDDQDGIQCNWWRTAGIITPKEVAERLTSANLDLHVNYYSQVKDTTPFISLSCGAVERDVVSKTNFVNSALHTALLYATDFGRKQFGYVYICWVLVALRPSVEIESVAEEVRNLNTYQRFSAYQPEGEITAKVIVPDNQVKECRRYDRNPRVKDFALSWRIPNPRFIPPEALSNIRDLD